MEVSRHYPDDGIRFITQHKRFADQLRICAKQIIPSVITEDDLVVAAGLVLFGQEVAA